jgi:putative spermidine/putrescine transport system substrate-binding protein
MKQSIRRLCSLALSALIVLGALTGCGAQETASGSGTQQQADLDLTTASWEEITAAAKGSTVTFYGWGGDENRNNWLNTTVADHLKEQYDITLKVVGMDINDILSKLSGEKQANQESGSIDMIWINGENFYSAKENGLLYGPFTGQLPNMEAYIDLQDPETQNDFCMPIEGYEAPYAKAQMVLLADTAVTPNLPHNAEELMEFCKENPGKVTYPALPDFTGSAFVRNLIYEICGWEQFMEMQPDYDTVKTAIEPALDYLRELNPYLWNQGKTFPESSTALDAMFSDGEVVMNMSYGPFDAALGIEQGTYSETTQTFVLDKGTIGNTNYMGIAFNSPNKAGAMVAINAILSGEIQLTQYAQLKSLPVVDQEKLSAQEREAFEQVDLGKGILTQAELLEHRLPEMPASLVPVIEEIWLNEVVGK